MTPSRATTLALVFVLLASAARARPGPESPIERVEKGLSSPVLVQGDPTWSIEERMKHYNVPGVSVAVVKDFKVAWAKAYGVKDVRTREPVTERTLFQAGSISKPVAATVALEEVERGKLKLEDDINLSLKSWKVPDNELTAGGKVTLAQLLSHTAGLTVHGFPGYEAGAKLPTLPQVLDGAPPANTPPVRVDMVPGTEFRYSGGGVTVMQLAVEDVEGKPFDAVAKAAVLDPLKMADSTYSQPLPERLQKAAASGHRSDGTVVPGRFHTYPEKAAAGLWTTPTDLATFGIEIQLSLAGRSNKVLSKPTVETMLTRYTSSETGLGFFLEERGDATYFWHNGADEGFRAILVLHKEKGYGVAVMVNSDTYEIMPEIVRAVAREYGWDGYPQPYKTVAIAPEKLGEYAGRYKIDSDSVLTVTADAGHLYGQEVFGSRFELLPISETELVRRDSETLYTFGRGASGPIHSVTMSAPGQSDQARRARPENMVPSEHLAAGRLAEAIEGYRKIRADYPEVESIGEARLNGLGYMMLRQNKVAEAIAIFKLNVEFYPRAWNTYDSLGEAYLASGDREEARKNYRRSLELNPANRNAAEALKKLEP